MNFNLIVFVFIVGSLGFIDTTPTQLDSLLKSKDKYVFVRYYAPWCGYCQQMAGDYKKLSKSMNSKKVCIRQIDCDKYGDYCTTAGIEGFPTLKLYKGNRMLDDYDQPRTFKSMRKYLQSYLE
ncbi:Protein disulfide isomerase [Entamoeba marina]